MIVRFSLLPVFLLLLFAFPVSLFAQTKAEKMEQSVKEARAFFDAKAFEKAGEKYAEAFSYQADYNFKKNEMIAWFKSDQCDRASEAGTLFLEKSDDISIEDRGDVKTVLVKCNLRNAKAELKSGNFEKTELLLNTTEASIEENAYPPGIDSEEMNEIGILRTQIAMLKGKPPTRKLSPQKPKEASLLGPVLTGSGAALVIGGVITLLVKESNKSKYTCSELLKSSDDCKVNDRFPASHISQAEINAAYGQATTLNRIGWGLITAGVGIGLVGGYIWWEDSIQIEASLSPVDHGFAFGFSTDF